MPSEHSFRRHFALERQNGGAGAVFFSGWAIFATIGFYFLAV
ncbi:TPA: hypothetical protein ACRHKB_RS02700 [Neisseria meningitidis]|nr:MULTISPECIES: hypothetical protein [Neisseria]MDZ3834169.1 hypothetical protein [Neisseria meningitidis]MDZ3839347.1 hypothetical protein [Neisseria meningitidis]